jgi:hypothetical protein
MTTDVHIGLVISAEGGTSRWSFLVCPSREGDAFTFPTFCPAGRPFHQAAHQRLCQLLGEDIPAQGRHKPKLLDVVCRDSATYLYFRAILPEVKIATDAAPCFWLPAARLTEVTETDKDILARLMEELAQ